MVNYYLPDHIPLPPFENNTNQLDHPPNQNNSFKREIKELKIEFSSVVRIIGKRFPWYLNLKSQINCSIMHSSTWPDWFITPLPNQLSYYPSILFSYQNNFVCFSLTIIYIIQPFIVCPPIECWTIVKHQWMNSGHQEIMIK